MNTNKISIIITIFALILIISIPTTYKIFKIHDNSLYSVINKKIVEAAKECYYNNECTENKIYLKDLYDLRKLEKVSDPITKEYYNEESYVLKSDNDFKFIVVN